MGNAWVKVFRRKVKLDPDDVWRQQNKEAQTNPMYKLASLEKGGSLVEAYDTGGEVDVEELARRDLGPGFLYPTKHVITRLQYARWVSRCHAKMTGGSLVDTRTDDQVLAEFQEDVFNKFSDHEACWSLSDRGGVGETVMHVLYLCDSATHTEIARILLSIYPKLALDYYEGSEYYGESCLHIAVIHNDFFSTKLLVESGADVHQRATGRFFLPEDQKERKTPNTNYDGYAYYGEYALSFAACKGYKNIYDFLISKGADPNHKDSFGNSCLHMIVINNQLDMFAYAVRHHNRKANMFLKNDQGLTPLTLASKLGRHKMFKIIMEIGSIENWRYTNIQCSVYPLSALDTVDADGGTNWNSALMFIIDGDKDEHLEMLDEGVIRQLLDDKWKTFARRRFLERLCLTIIHLVILSTGVYLRPDSTSDLIGPTDTSSIVRYVCEISVCANGLVFLVFETLEVRSQGIRGLLKNLKNAPAQALFAVSCILILAAIPFRFSKHAVVEETLLIISLPMAWAYLLFFARLTQILGPNVVMMYRIIKYDIFRFLIIYVVVMFGFGQAFYFLFKDISNTSIQTFLTPWGSIMTLIQMTFGEFEYDEFNSVRYPALAKIVFMLFMMLVPILLLNMLIAMMGNTYHQVISKSEKEWRRQWAQVVTVLERSYTKQTMLGYRNKYSTPLKGAVDGYSEDGGKGQGHQAGLMVIKTTSKTLARQRKTAISNWKKVFNEVKKRIVEHKQLGAPGPIFPDSDFPQDLYEALGPQDMSRTHSRNVSPDQARGLMSLIEDMAWEKDIDLTKGKAFSKNTPMTLDELLAPSVRSYDNPAFDDTEIVSACQTESNMPDKG